MQPAYALYKQHGSESPAPTSNHSLLMVPTQSYVWSGCFMGGRIRVYLQSPPPVLLPLGHVARDHTCTFACCRGSIEHEDVDLHTLIPSVFLKVLIPPSPGFPCRFAYFLIVHHSILCVCWEPKKARQILSFGL